MQPTMEPYSRHVLVCTGGYCSPNRGGRELYALLPELLQEADLLFGPGRVKRGETPCLGVCAGGPIVVGEVVLGRPLSLAQPPDFAGTDKRWVAPQVRGAIGSWGTYALGLGGHPPPDLPHVVPARRGGVVGVVRAGLPGLRRRQPARGGTGR